MGLRCAREDGDRVLVFVEHIDDDVVVRIFVAAHVPLFVSGGRAVGERRARSTAARSGPALLPPFTPCDTSRMRFVIALSLIVVTLVLNVVALER